MSKGKEPPGLTVAEAQRGPVGAFASRPDTKLWQTVQGQGGKAALGAARKQEVAKEGPWEQDMPVKATPPGAHFFRQAPTPSSHSAMSSFTSPCLLSGSSHFSSTQDPAFSTGAIWVSLSDGNHKSQCLEEAWTVRRGTPVQRCARLWKTWLKTRNSC